jgi:hypothetical protein
MGDAGIEPPASKRTPPDPTITFTWNEAPPAAGACQAGTYVGTFTCNYLEAGADPSTGIEVTGPVAFTLVKSQNGEFLEISQGSVDGYAAFIINFTAPLTGRLDCSTNQLSASANEGTFGFGDAMLLPAGTFVGSLTGMLDPSTATLNGQWSLMPTSLLTLGGGACVGPWTATWAP